MSIKDLIQSALADGFRAFDRTDGAVVTTHCLYPSGEFVRVAVRGGRESFFVSDDGGALTQIEAAGAEIEKPDRLLRSVMKDSGLSMSKVGIISAPSVGVDGLALAIALVANQSATIAEWMFRHLKIERKRDFKALLKQFLELRFTTQMQHAVLIGQSNKPHKFEHLIQLHDGSRIIVDPVINDPQSINARVVAHVDIKLANLPSLEQRLVYDDEEDWKADDLSLLQVGAPIVMPFSAAAKVFERIARVQ